LPGNRQDIRFRRHHPRLPQRQGTAFYEHRDFQALPGYPYRLFLSAKQLDAMMT
jgi:hypothetical protein